MYNHPHFVAIYTPGLNRVKNYTNQRSNFPWELGPKSNLV